ncbi:hypothetical protein D3C81_2105760 [compost metagenome]
MVAIQQILGLLAIHGVEIDPSKAGRIFLQLDQHLFDVALHVLMLFACQFCDFARRHRARHETVSLILWRDP